MKYENFDKAKELTSNELRLGNWINQKDIRPNGEYGNMVECLIPVRVDIPILSEIEKGNKLERYSGIPITVEILDKCLHGYKKEREWRWNSPDFGRLTIVNIDEMWDVYNYNNLICNIRFVHELQNLYPWIMQKELEVEI